MSTCTLLPATDLLDGVLDAEERGSELLVSELRTANASRPGGTGWSSCRSALPGAARHQRQR